MLTLVPSATLAINERCSELEQSGRTIHRFGFGQSPFPVPDPVVSRLKQYAHRKEYLPVRGLPWLRHEVAGFHQRRQGLDYDPHRILVGPGSKELMFLLMMMWDGDVLLPSPSWVSYEPQARLAGRKVTWVDTSGKDGWRLTPANLKKALKKAKNPMLVLNYPNNPTGVTYADKQLKALAEAAREAGCLILSDEIYGELHHQGKHKSVASFYPEKTVLSSGLSKWCGAGGWRLGTMCFPEQLDELASKVAAAASETYTSACTPVQYAATAAFEDSAAIGGYLTRCRMLLRAAGEYTHKRLTEAGLKVAAPEGGFYLFPDFGPRTKKIKSSRELCEKLLDEAGVALLPGSAFGRPEKELTTRLAYVPFDGERALRLGSFTADEVPNKLRRLAAGLDALVDWLG